MSFRPKTLMLLALASGLVLHGASASRRILAQPAHSLAGTQFELAENVQIERVDNQVRTELERVAAHLADRQWSEAVETLRRVLENSGGMLMAVHPTRFVTVREYCQMRLAALPAEALAVYRARVDPLAERWYREGLARLDRRPLLDVIEQAFASSWGDDALLALGEMALHAGDYQAARWHWERIVPVPSEAAPGWPAYPDTDLDLAAVRARLVLVSILEGDPPRAERELAEFARLHPQARGAWAGQETEYASALRSLLRESDQWPTPLPDSDWPTLAGSAQRNKILPQVVDLAGVAWRSSLLPRGQAGHAVPSSASPGPEQLGYHPVYVAGRIFAVNQNEVLAWNAVTGQPAWGSTAAIYRDQLDGGVAWSSHPAERFGAVRHTLTIADGKLYARVGSPITDRPMASTVQVAPAALVALDLAAEGRLLWKYVPEDGWALEGSPVVRGSSVFVAMRRSDIRPQAHIACLDGRNGQLLWRRFICAAETPARGQLFEATHQLLTLVGESVYYNTNLGAVAAVGTRDGQVQWVTVYPRTRQGDRSRLAAHWRRDLNPCLYHRGALLVAPADSPRIFALDAMTGQILWQTGPEVADVQHLLGATDDWLVASGDRLYFVNLKEGQQGRLGRVWPEGGERMGYGRGLMAGNAVYWPTRQRIYRVNLRTVLPEKVYDLEPRGLAGGNLLLAGDRLLVATPRELIALHAAPGRQAAPNSEIVSIAESSHRVPWPRLRGHAVSGFGMPTASVGMAPSRVSTGGRDLLRSGDRLFPLYEE